MATGSRARPPRCRTALASPFDPGQPPLDVSQSGESPAETLAPVPLRVALTREVDVAAALDALSSVSWLGPPAGSPADGPQVRRIAADLELPILDGSGAGVVRKAALIDVGQPRMIGGSVIVSIAWRSATFSPLFPVFAGELRITRAGLVLDGRYAPPFGRLGLLIDATLLHFVARRTAQAFLARVAEHLGGG